ncbi:hypothetical protein KAU88_09585 [Candidatus Bathyarchaeota archaeon]|nr:hypothetical protein [Candidatus Bathyarchaeota archaeon]
MKEVAKKVKFLKHIDIDKIDIKRDRYFSNAYIIDLPLDSSPDHVWQDIFEREWKSSRHLWDRKLYVMGDKLRLVTSPDNVEEKLDWVKEVMEQTNKGIDRYNLEAEALEADTAQRIREQILDEEKANTEMIREAMRKRFGAL